MPSTGGTLTGFFNSMAGAFSEANKVLRPQAAFLTGNNGMPIIYNEVRSEPMARYKKVTLQVPNTSGNAVDAITTVPTVSTLSGAFTDVTLDTMPAWGFEIYALDDLYAASPGQLRSAYVDEAIIKLVRFANDKIASIFTTTNYSTSGNITGAAGQYVPLSDFTKMFGTLAARDVNVDDTGKLSFVAHSNVYTNFLADTNWREAAKVGDTRAQNQIGTGVLPITYGARPLRDNQVPTVASPLSYTSIYMHERAAALVTAPLPAPEATVAYSYETFGPLTILITIQYVPNQPHHILWFHTLMGVVPWRIDHAVIHKTTA